MTLFTLFMVTNHKHLYEPRAKYIDYVLQLFSLQDITIGPKSRINVSFDVSVQMCDNRLADQSPFLMLIDHNLAVQSISTSENPAYVFNRYNYIQPAVTLVNNSDREVSIPKESPIVSISNTALFDLIIIDS